MEQGSLSSRIINSSSGGDGKWAGGEHDDVTKWKHFPRNWPFVRGIHRSPVNSLPKGQWLGALMFSLICVWMNDWVNNREAGDLWRYRAHYDVIVMDGQAVIEFAPCDMASCDRSGFKTTTEDKQYSRGSRRMAPPQKFLDQLWPLPLVCHLLAWSAQYTVYTRGFSISRLPLSYLLFCGAFYTQPRVFGLDIIKMPFNWVAEQLVGPLPESDRGTGWS